MRIDLGRRQGPSAFQFETISKGFPQTFYLLRADNLSGTKHPNPACLEQQARLRMEILRPYLSAFTDSPRMLTIRSI